MLKIAYSYQVARNLSSPKTNILWCYYYHFCHPYLNSFSNLHVN